MATKRFAEKLNDILDDLEYPRELKRRSELFAKVTGIPQEPASQFLNGIALPNDCLLLKICRELDIRFEDLNCKIH